MTRITTCIFDAYGTLFDVSAAARALAGEGGARALGRGLAAGRRRLAGPSSWNTPGCAR